MNIIEIDDKTRSEVDRMIEDGWAGPWVVSRGRLIDTRENPGFVCLDAAGRVLGFAMYRIEGGECELTVLDVSDEGKGIGTALMERVRRVAEDSGCGRLFLVTTNDNTHAIRFYQRRGMSLCAVRLNALERARRLKPGIPETGFGGIPIAHEFEFEWKL